MKSSRRKQKEKKEDRLLNPIVYFIVARIIYPTQLFKIKKINKRKKIIEHNTIFGIGKTRKIEMKRYNFEGGKREQKSGTGK